LRVNKNKAGTEIKINKFDIRMLISATLSFKVTALIYAIIAIIEMANEYIEKLTDIFPRGLEYIE
jgi:hypothetical protein